MCTSQFKDSVPQDCPHFRYQMQVLGQPYSCLNNYKLGSYNLLLKFTNLLEWLIGHRKALYCVYQFIRKDVTQEQPDGRGAQGKVLGGRVCTELSCHLQVHHSLSTSMCLLTQKLITFYYLRVFIGLNLHLSPSQRLGGRAKSSKPLTHLTFLVTSSILRLSLGPTQSFLL